MRRSRRGRGGGRRPRRRLHLAAGLWMAHCHVLEHAEAGMMTLVEVR